MHGWSAHSILSKIILDVEQKHSFEICYLPGVSSLTRRSANSKTSSSNCEGVGNVCFAVATVEVWYCLSNPSPIFATDDGLFDTPEEL